MHTRAAAAENNFSRAAGMPSGAVCKGYAIYFAKEEKK